MKKLLFILLACMPTVLKAQTNNSPTVIPDGVQYVVDGEESNQLALNSIDPNTILRIDVLKSDKSSAVHFPSKCTVIITTNPYAVKHYREVLSSFSKDLQNWLTSNDTTKAQLRYFIDGEEIQENTGTGKGRLYDLTKEQIKSVSLIEDEPKDSNYAAKVKIETKK